MKHIHLLFPLLALAALFSCAPNYQEDINRLNDQYANLDRRVELLEQSVSNLNDQIKQLSVFAAAVEQNFYITAVSSHDDVYELTLSNGNTIVLQMGPGNTLLPASPVSIMQIGGLFYWTVKGVLLTGPDGLPIRSTDPVPVLKYDSVTQEYLISVDGGVTFKNVNVYASVVINNEVLMQVINGYFSQHSSVLLDRQMLFRIVSAYIQKNYSTLFDVEILDQVVATYISQYFERLFSYRLLEQIFSQYDFEYYTSKIDVDNLVNVIITFLREHGEILMDNEVLFEIITSYIRANQSTVFSTEMLLEVINEFISSSQLVIDADLLTRVVTDYIDKNRDVVFDTEVVRAMLMRYVQKYYVQAFNENVLVRLLNLYISDNSSTIFNETLIRDILDVYVQNSFSNVLTQEMVYGIVNTYVEQNAGTFINSEVFYDVISNYFQANYDLIVDRTLITNLFNTYIEEHKDTIISASVIETVVANYLLEYYREVFSADVLSLVVRNYFEQNMQVLQEYITQNSDIVSAISSNSDYCEITLRDGGSMKLLVYDEYARLRDRVQSIVLIPEANGHVLEQKGYKNTGVLYLTYIISPADMSSVIQNKYQKKELSISFRTTDESGNVGTLEAYEPHQVSNGHIFVTAETPSFGSVKNIALYIKDDITGGTDLMTEFTPVDTEAPQAWEPEYIDLGLPSGIKWATCNVGATKPEEYGDYFAWGETEPKSSYTWNTYKYSLYGSWTAFSRYEPDASIDTYDNRTTFADYSFEDDAARVIWKDKWRTPTVTEWQELLDNCTWQKTTNYNGTGETGYIVTSKKYSKRSIFLPSAGTKVPPSATVLGPSGHYMSSCLYTNLETVSFSQFVLNFVIPSSSVETTWSDRSDGVSVRPVYGDFVRMSSVELKEKSPFSMKVGQTYTLTPVFDPENASYKTLRWISQDPDIVGVDGNGTVTAFKAGTTTIEIWPVDRSGHPWWFNITVSN